MRLVSGIREMVGDVAKEGQDAIDHPVNTVDVVAVPCGDLFGRSVGRSRRIGYTGVGLWWTSQLCWIQKRPLALGHKRDKAFVQNSQALIAGFCADGPKQVHPGDVEVEQIADTAVDVDVQARKLDRSHLAHQGMRIVAIKFSKPRVIVNLPSPSPKSLVFGTPSRPLSWKGSPSSRVIFPVLPLGLVIGW